MVSQSLENVRRGYRPAIASLLEQIEELQTKESQDGGAHSELSTIFPKTYQQKTGFFKAGANVVKRSRAKVGVIFSGGQAPGGHNVIAGLFDACAQIYSEFELLGFLEGPRGLIEDQWIALDAEVVDAYRNLGGFDMIGSGRTKIESSAQFEAVRKTVTAHGLDGLVVIGGDDSNTNAALLAEDFVQHGVGTQVIGVPKTIDGDLKNRFVELSFGFDTATRVYSEMIGNIATDARSAKKYTHFIKLMGRSASHVTLECALKVQPNFAIIAEEVQAKEQSLGQIVEELTDLVMARSKVGKEYGVILIPEGLLEFIPEVKRLIDQLNAKLEVSALEESERAIFESLPRLIQDQLLSDRDPHGNVQLSHIDTEKLLVQMVELELKRRNFSGAFHPLTHFFGYEGRSGFPSNFDATYCYNLGFVAAALIKEGKTGYLCALKNLMQEVRDWQPVGVALVDLIEMQERKGKLKPVIAKALVELDGGPFLSFSEKREGWKLGDDYVQSGPIQFGDSADLCNAPPLTLALESSVVS